MPWLVHVQAIGYIAAIHTLLQLEYTVVEA
jgi:hypothetical protein